MTLHNAPPSVYRDEPIITGGGGRLFTGAAVGCRCGRRRPDRPGRRRRAASQNSGPACRRRRRLRGRGSAGEPRAPVTGVWRPSPAPRDPSSVPCDPRVCRDKCHGAAVASGTAVGFGGAHGRPNRHSGTAGRPDAPHRLCGMMTE